MKLKYSSKLFFMGKNFGVLALIFFSMKERNKSDKPKNNQQTKSSIIGERNSHFSDKKVKIALRLTARKIKAEKKYQTKSWL